VEQGVSASVIHRYGFDDVRRLAAGLGAAAGLSPTRSLALAKHLLWFDAAGAPILGIATLPSWLEAIERREIDPMAAGRVISERTSVAVLDGENGPAPLILERAAEVAVEKARESAVGLVRVVGSGSIRSAAPVAAGVAIGPMAGWVLGPNHCWSLALPTQGGLPLVVDSGLSTAEPGENSGAPGATGRRGSTPSRSSSTGPDGRASASPLLEGLRRATEVLVPEGGWLVASVSIPALEAFATFEERLAAVAAGMTAAPGRLLPEAWEASRREVRRAGIAVEATAWKSIAQWARRLAVDLPDPLADGTDRPARAGASP
jgi:LDH2 family malate/lactate/ureidoglycolate dehydrogenase